jgi:RND family efflux transporter MFP subunit
MNTMNRRFAILVSAAVVTLGFGCGHDEPDRSRAELEPLTVTVAAVEARSEARPIEVRGIVQPTRQSAVSSRVAGPVIALHVNAGSQVRKGQVLLEIDPQASQGQLAQSEGALAQAQAALALAERNFERFEALYAEKAVAEQELDMSRKQYEQAKGAVEQAKGAVQTAASVAQESAVRAPFSARIVATRVEVGDLATPGRPLVELESLGSQQIWLAVRESDISRVSEGGTIEVGIDALPELGVISGAVEEIVPSADPATHTFTVKVGLGAVRVPSGFSGKGLISGDIIDRLVVPVTAVHQRGGLELVVVRAEDGTARTRAVTTGSSLENGRIEILSGLDAGDEVVLDAPGPLTDGTPLEIAR